MNAIHRILPQGINRGTQIRHDGGVCLPIYELHGLHIRSEVALHAPVCQTDSPDLDVRWGEDCAIPDQLPAGRVLATLSLADGRGYTHMDTGTGYALCFHQTCEFRTDYHRRLIRVHLAPNVEPGIVPLLLVGNVVAALLTLSGECVLHASAVEIDGVALAFVGSSGMGKSTLAALLCASGARLITDDVLRLEQDGNGFRCFVGASEIRLRQEAAGLAERFPAAVTGTTADNRLAIRLDDNRSSRPRLHAIVIPHPSRTVRELRLTRLTQPQALFSLARYPRVLGWQTSEPVRRQFEAFGRVARSVPVFDAEIPWGLTFAPELPRMLLEGTGLHGRLAEALA